MGKMANSFQEERSVRTTQLPVTGGTSFGPVEDSTHS
jgi:hypothetical protein